MADVMRKGLGGMGKMGADMPKAEAKKPLQPDAPKMGEEKTSTITHHADGTHSSQMHGGEPMEHPDHKHLMAHIGHHLTGGDAHHVVHDDGMEAHSHFVNEAGEHEDSGNSAEEAKQSLDKFFGEEAQEPEHQEEMPMHGGMGA